MGTVAFVIPFATVKRSGITPKCCDANGFRGGRSRDHFVEDEQDSVARADFAQALQVAERRHEYAGRPATGSTITAAMVEGSCSRQSRSELVGELGAVLRLALEKALRARSWVCRMWSTPATPGPNSFLLSGDAAHRHPAEVHAVVAALAADEPEASRLAARAVVGERDLERRVGRFGA